MVLCLKQTGALVFEPSGALPLLVEIVLCKSSRGKKGVLQPRSPLLCGEALGTVTALAREATLDSPPPSGVQLQRVGGAVLLVKGRVDPADQIRAAGGGFPHWWFLCGPVHHLAKVREMCHGQLLESSCGSAEQLRGGVGSRGEEPGLGLGLKGDAGLGPNFKLRPQIQLGRAMRNIWLISGQWCIPSPLDFSLIKSK